MEDLDKDHKQAIKLVCIVLLGITLLYILLGRLL
jgi:hypothetical protein